MELEEYGLLYGIDEIYNSELKSNKIGYVYIIKNKTLHTIKIGKSVNPRKRIRDIQNAAGCEMETIALIPCKLYSELEKDLHSEFGQDRLDYGEWFNLSTNIRQFIDMIDVDWGVR